ncbi:MAG TPA: DMT family transporter [Steroidobacteraceae bacterium]|nr:DMT family transporter [Steroidobacteraceae bacterium]
MSSSSGRPRHAFKGIVCMVGAVAAFAGMDALLKVFSTAYPAMEVAALRGAASLPFLLAPLLLTGRLSELRPRRFGLHLLRGLLTVGVIWGFVYSVRVLSLADAYSIFLAAPLIVTALSAPLLKEHVDGRNWFVIVIGLVGVLTMLRPSASSLMTLGAIAALFSATAYALGAVALRVVTRTDTTASIVFWTIALMTMCTALLAVDGWVPVRPQHWGLLAAMGVLGAIGQSLLTEAFRAAPPSTVAPFEYTALLWGMGIDWAFWGVLPGARILLGGGIVIGSGLYLIWSERNKAAVPESPHT